MAHLPIIAAGTAILGGGISAAGALQRGQAENDAAQSEALQLEARGKEEFAASQRDALLKRQEGRLINSRIQALSAASGGGADDATIIKLMSGVSQDAEYNAQTAMYGGTQRRGGLMDAAVNRRKGGRASLMGSQFEAAGAFLGGINRAAGSFG